MSQVFENDPGRSSGIDLNNRPISTECGRDETQETQTVCQPWRDRLSGLISRIYTGDIFARQNGAVEILDFIQINEHSSKEMEDWSDQISGRDQRK